MEFFSKEMSITFDELEGAYTITLGTSRDGTIMQTKCNSLQEVFDYISKTTKTKITYFLV